MCLMPGNCAYQQKAQQAWAAGSLQTLPSAGRPETDKVDAVGATKTVDTCTARVTFVFEVRHLDGCRDALGLSCS